MLATKAPQSALPDHRALLSARDLQRLTGLHRQTVYRLMQEGKVPGVRRLGGRIFVVREAFERWLESSPPLRAERRA